MGLLGGSRIDGITIFLVSLLVLYTILVAGITATFEGSDFIDPFGGKNLNFGDIGDYSTSDYENITRPLILNTVYLRDLDPDGKVEWYANLFDEEDSFNVGRLGIDWWDGWIWYSLEPERILESEIITDFDFAKNYSRYFLDRGSKVETTAFFCPQFYYNESSGQPTYLYDNIQDSFDNDVITVILASNMSLTGYDAGKVIGIITGFSTYSIPNEVSVLIAGIFWALVILLIVKLVIG